MAENPKPEDRAPQDDIQQKIAAAEAAERRAAIARGLMSDSDGVVEGAGGEVSRQLNREARAARRAADIAQAEQIVDAAGPNAAKILEERAEGAAKKVTIFRGVLAGDDNMSREIGRQFSNEARIARLAADIARDREEQAKGPKGSLPTR